MTTTPPVTLDEFKKHLNLTTGAGSEDAELTLALEAATEAIEQHVGPLVTREVIDRVYPSRNGYLILSQAPVVSVSSVTEVVDGVATAIVGLDVDTRVTLNGSGIFDLGHWATSARQYEVTYTAGLGAEAAVPARFKMAVMIVGEHLWETQRGRAGRNAGRFGTSEDEQSSDFLRGFAIPRRALELIEFDRQPTIA